MANFTPDWLARVRPEPHLIGHGEWAPGTVEPPRYLLDHELVVFARGTCRVTIDGRAHQCADRTFVIIPPGRLHTSVAMSGGQVHRYWAHFDWTPSSRGTPEPLYTYAANRPRKSALHLPPAFVPGQPLLGKVRQAAHVQSLFQSLASRWNAGSAVEAATCSAVLLELLLRLLVTNQPAPALDRRRALAFEVQQCLEACSMRPVSVREQLETLGFSYAHLCRVFRAEFGIPPVRYLNAQRVERGKLLLEDPRLSVTQVAFECGFEDPAYFGRVFRQYVGVSPSEYASRAAAGRPKQ